MPCLLQPAVAIVNSGMRQPRHAHTSQHTPPIRWLFPFVPSSKMYPEPYSRIGIDVPFKGEYPNSHVVSVLWPVLNLCAACCPTAKPSLYTCLCR